MNHKRWTKILTLYLEIYEEEMVETRPENKPTFISWLNNELGDAKEITAQLAELGINPISKRDI